jgi:capsular exopolysaccharide synthesis family protein
MITEPGVSLVPGPHTSVAPYPYPYPPLAQPGSRRPSTGLFVQLWRRRVIFFSVFVVVIGMIAGVVSLLPAYYVATGSIMVEPRDSATGESSAALIEKLGDPADLESQLILIHSPRLLRAAIDKPEIQQTIRAECELVRSGSGLGGLIAHLTGGAGCDTLVPGSEAMLDWVTARYSIGSLGRSRVIAISYQSPSAQTAQIMANALISTYLHDEIDQKVESRKAAVDWLWNEVHQLAAELKSADLAIQSYREQHGLVSGQTSTISSEQLTSVAQQLALAQASQAQAAARIKEVSGRGGDARPVLDSRTIADLKQQLSQITAEIANDKPLYGRGHPVMVSLERQRDDIQARIAGETQNIVASASQAYAAATTEVAALTRQMDQLKRAVGGDTGSEAALASMIRDADVRRELYVEIYKKANQLETERRVLTGDAHLVSYAEVPSVAAFPKKTPFAAAGLMIAAILATGAAFARDMMDRTVRGAEALEDLVGVPVIAQIPRAPRQGAGSRDPMVAVRESSAFQEAIRTLDAALALARHERPVRTVLLTSTAPREGKTFTTLALAQFAAASGRRVLVIEADLRCPTFAPVLGLDRQAGLVDYLNGLATLEQTVRPMATPGLHVMTAGLSHLGSTELLAGPRFAELLEQTDDYDLVLIDSPPSELLMDARIMARAVDGILFCAAWARSDSMGVTTGIANLQRAGGKVLGCAVTMVRQGEYPLYSRRPLPARPYLLTT